MQESDETAEDFVPYHTVKQRRLRQVCAYTKTHQSLPCYHTQSMDVDEDSDQSLDLWIHGIRQHGYFFYLFCFLCPSQQFFSYVGTDLPGLNQ